MCTVVPQSTKLALGYIGNPPGVVAALVVLEIIPCSGLDIVLGAFTWPDEGAHMLEAHITSPTAMSLELSLECPHRDLPSLGALKPTSAVEAAYHWMDASHSWTVISAAGLIVDMQYTSSIANPKSVQVHSIYGTPRRSTESLFSQGQTFKDRFMETFFK